MNESNEIFNKLVLTGGLRFAGKDPETGENMYVKTEMLKDIDPKLDVALGKYFSEMSMRLWEKGFIDMDVTDANPIVSLNKKSLDPDQVKKLDANERSALKQLIKLLFNKK
ncbi:MAG: hypothetical protein ACK5P0_02290 [bacterium]|jgi:hypothetical protein